MKLFPIYYRYLDRNKLSTIPVDVFKNNPNIQNL